MKYRFGDFFAKIQRLVFYIIALIKFSSQYIVFSSFILILVLYRLKVSPGRETSNLELGFRKSLLVVTLPGFLDQPDNFVLELQILKSLLVVTLAVL